ncbi:hypothetical protein Aple_102830 [Acrocarpospora pleiomorpha]|uniref:Uncharacterized protein n=1 Tax=Acrocarpospora pleiomorpha TaxID=90975 RepID=A0A5M3Y521_9ACTN|nr:hypothetical protein Aple_102830 [Acrocarpospora pleiomorpha]
MPGRDPLDKRSPKPVDPRGAHVASPFCQADASSGQVGMQYDPDGGWSLEASKFTKIHNT